MVLRPGFSVVAILDAGYALTCDDVDQSQLDTWIGDIFRFILTLIDKFSSEWTSTSCRTVKVLLFKVAIYPKKKRLQTIGVEFQNV